MSVWPDWTCSPKTNASEGYEEHRTYFDYGSACWLCAVCKVDMDEIIAAWDEKPDGEVEDMD